MKTPARQPPAAGSGEQMPPAPTDSAPGDSNRSQYRDAGLDHSCLARPGTPSDWRMVLAYEATVEAGILAALPATPAELAARLELDERAVRALLEALAVWRVVELDEHGRYSSGTGAPSPEDDAVLRQHAAVIRRWAVLLGDRLQDRTATSDQLSARARPDVWLDFLAANARRLAPTVLDVCTRRFPHSKRVLDLGGGHGEYSLELTRRGLHPMLQDLPDVVEMADRGDRLGKAGVELFPGDFFETLPPGPFDLVLCAGVTHTFDGERNLALYRRIRAVLAPGGGLAIVTFLRGRNPVASIFALQMLVATDAGDAHGEDDYRRWLGEAGYGPLEVQDLESRPQTVLLAGR